MTLRCCLVMMVTIYLLYLKVNLHCFYILNIYILKMKYYRYIRTTLNYLKIEFPDGVMTVHCSLFAFFSVRMVTLCL